MNLSTLPSEALVDELLGSARSASPSTESQLSHVLGVAKELLLRGLSRDMQATNVISSPSALRDWLRLYCADLQHEVFLVLFLDAHHRVFEVEPMFRGTVTQTAVYPREVVKAALSRNAAAVALAHSVARHRMRLMCPEPLCARVLSPPGWMGQLRRRRGT